MAEADPQITGPALPPQVQQLAARERQIASLIFISGGLTAKEIEDSIAGEISNAAIRSMLSRLCDKKILKRRKVPLETKSCGKRIAFLYLPAIDDAAVKSRALQQVARDYFNGSLVRLMAQAADELLLRESGGRRESRRPG